MVNLLNHACVIRGQVVTSDGTPLVGVNISFINNPAYGYTITRQDGRTEKPFIDWLAELLAGRPGGLGGGCPDVLECDVEAVRGQGGAGSGVVRGRVVRGSGWVRGGGGGAGSGWCGVGGGAGSGVVRGRGWCGVGVVRGQGGAGSGVVAGSGGGCGVGAVRGQGRCGGGAVRGRVVRGQGWCGVRVGAGSGCGAGSGWCGVRGGAGSGWCGVGVVRGQGGAGSGWCGVRVVRGRVVRGRGWCGVGVGAGSGWCGVGVVRGQGGAGSGAGRCGIGAVRGRGGAGAVRCGVGGGCGVGAVRGQGRFDLVTNGGVAIALRFERAPFITQEHTLWLPWGRFFVMDTVVMRHEENEIPSCDVSGFTRPSPIVSPAPLTVFRWGLLREGDHQHVIMALQEEVPIPGTDMALSYLSSRALQEEVPIPGTDMALSYLSSRALQEEVPIPGTDMALSYLSSRTPGYKSILRVTLTHPTVPFNLMKVHLMVAVEGRLFRKWFPAAPNLNYDFIWDKADVYSQKVYGLSEAFVSVGYEYESCPDLILWEKRTAVLQGYEITASNLGGWALDKHHALNIQSGILHMGNGENVFVSQQPPVIGSVMGNGRRRSISCPSCNGLADGNKLLAPVALACGSDGSLYVGDFNYVRRIFTTGNSS
ncbi:unnamed protein product [Coregonus sp. 'balchen']|nr:unnamed protein product [Coregonus sp. 'balchen']